MCPDHGTKPEFIKEKNYFFKLTKYADQVKEIIQNDTIKIFPKARKNEILNLIDQNKLPTIRVDKQVNIVAKANFGFGDVNSCLIISKYNK